MKRTVFILSMLISCNVYAEIVTGEACGDDCTWTFNTDTRELIISGTGEIGDYRRYCDNPITCTTDAPWFSYADNISTITVNEGIKTIGENAFADLYKMTTVNLPDGLKTIRSAAMVESHSLSNVNLPAGLERIEGSAFAGALLENVVIPDSVTYIGARAFRAIEDKFGSENASPLKSFVVGENTVLDEKVFLMWDTDEPLDLNKFKMYCAEGNTSCIAALENTFNEAQTRGLVDSSAQVYDYLMSYTKDTNGFYQIGDSLYANADLMTHGAACDDAANCQAILDAVAQGKPFDVGGKYYATLDLFANGAACTDAKNCQDILSSNGNPFKVGSKIYNSLEDFAKGNNVKFRIYTIDEANAVAGTVNRVSIKYR